MSYDDLSVKEVAAPVIRRWTMRRIVTAALHYAEHGSLDEAALELVRCGEMSEESSVREFSRTFRAHILGISDAIKHPRNQEGNR